MSIIESIQLECAQQLQADPFFANLTVLVEHIADLQSQFDQAIGAVTVVGGKSGAVVVIMTPTADANWENVPGPFFDAINVIVLVAENPLVNNDPISGTGLSALTICEKIAGILHQSFPLAANGPLVAQKPTISRGPNAGDDTSLVQYNLHFRTMGGLRAVPPQLAPVVISNTAGVVTLTSATPGSAVFYTLDGSNASPRGATASLYTAPFTPGAGHTLNARAWLAGYLASNNATITT